MLRAPQSAPTKKVIENADAVLRVCTPAKFFFGERLVLVGTRLLNVCIISTGEQIHALNPALG